MPPTLDTTTQQNSSEFRWSGMLSKKDVRNCAKMVFERLGARIFWGWLDYQLGLVDAPRVAILEHGDPIWGPKSDPK